MVTTKEWIPASAKDTSKHRALGRADRLEEVGRVAVAVWEVVVTGEGVAEEDVEDRIEKNCRFCVRYHCAPSLKSFIINLNEKYYFLDRVLDESIDKKYLVNAYVYN